MTDILIECSLIVVAAFIPAWYVHKRDYPKATFAALLFMAGIFK